MKKMAEEDKLEELDELTKRLITSGEYSRWPENIVPYQFQRGLSRDNINLIEQSIKEWQAVTCLRFEPYYKAESLGLDHGQRMFFQNTESGCWAKLGFLGKYYAARGKYNQVNLEPNVGGSGCWFKRVILHEIGHGLGLYHQQSRPDRDQNLVVTKANVQPDKWDQYTIPQKGAYVDLEKNIPYDYTSVMHYGKYSFVKKDEYGKPTAGFTMRPRQPCYLDVIGNSKKISFYDAKLVNLMHKCNKGCREACNLEEKSRNCYTTKVGVKGCKCLCPVDSDDKCKGKGINFKCPEKFPGEVVFKCSNGYCLNPELRCDGIDHCGNGDDERGCEGSCPKGDLNPNQRTVDSKVMRTCKQYYAGYPTVTCLSEETKDVCCETCKQATTPCRDSPGCSSWRFPNDCKYVNVKEECPVSCKLAYRGETKCPKPAPCTEDKAIQLTIGQDGYQTCAQLFKDYPTYTCTHSSYATKCCKTCESAKTPCKDMDDCSRKDCRYLTYQNDCPVKCKLAKSGEKKCPSGGGSSSGGNSNSSSGGSTGGNSNGSSGGNNGSTVGSGGDSGSSSCTDLGSNCNDVKSQLIFGYGLSVWNQQCQTHPQIKSYCKKSCGTC